MKMKPLLFESLCLCLVWLATNQADGQGVAPVEWGSEFPWSTDGNYTARGLCRFMFSDTYQAGEFTVNVTFDKELTGFDDFNNWERIDANPGFWYNSQSKWNLYDGMEQRIAFLGSWETSTGIEQPNGFCIGNVGTPSITTSGTTPSTTPTPAGCEIPVVYSNTVWMNDGASITQGGCKLTFKENYPIGGVTVNVTFDGVTSDFNDFNNFERISADSTGLWYSGSSKWIFASNEEWDYDFQVTWADGDPPSGTCYTNVPCDDPTTTPGH